MAQRERVYLEHLILAGDLATTHEETRAGFVSLAMERNRQATPLVEEARALQDAARHAQTPHDLLQIPGIETGLLYAAGMSEKALHHLQPNDKTEAITNLIRDHLEPAGDGFMEELIFRFLVTRGETLSESMRNISGLLAQRKLTRALISALNVAGMPYRWRARAASWTDMSEDDAEIERTLQGLTWGSGSDSRTLLYNLNVPIVGTVVDICLFGGGPQMVVQSGYAEYSLFLALGELRGSTDPASGEEHSKLYGARLNRIRASFEESRHMPLMFYIGAAVEQHMALALWEGLQNGELANAANLNRHEQLNAISRWMVML